MSDSNLKTQLIRLAYENPSLRKHLLPLVTAKKMTPYEAYKKAEKEGPSDDTRNIASESPDWAFMYAKKIDKKSHPVTMRGVQKNPRLEIQYYKDFGIEDYLRPSKKEDDPNSFEEAIKGKRFKHPETGNKVLFKSLPAEEQTKIRKEWSKKK